MITFARDVNIPLGRPGEWIRFDREKSPKQVEDVLTRITPANGTDLHKAFAAAFQLRAQGLDTIYLFSDGLPNEGEGLTPEQARTVKDETQRSNLLGKFIRRQLQSEWNRPLRDRERVRINAVGFFYESPDVGAFLWALARENEGSFVGMSKP